MKTELFCRAKPVCDSMELIVYDSENPETLSDHVVCNDCQDKAISNERRMTLIAELANHVIEDRDLEQIERLVEHLYGRKKDRRLTDAGFYSLTPAKRKKLKRQIDDEFRGPRPEVK